MFRRRIRSIMASFHQTASFSPLFAALFYSQPSWQAECFSPSQMGLIDQLTWDQHVSLIWLCVWLMLCSGVGCVSMCVCVKRTADITTEATWGFSDKGLIHFIELWSAAIYFYCELIACEWALDGISYDTWAFLAHLGFFFGALASH